MTREEALNLIGTRRVKPQIYSRKHHLPIPGMGGTVHECVRVSGACCVSKNGCFENFTQAWITAYEGEETMWLDADAFATWPLAEMGVQTESQKEARA